MTLVQRSTHRLFFQQQDMDFYLQGMLGRQSLLGSELGECLQAARHIDDGDPESWQSAWSAVAANVLAKAEESLAGGHTISAREALLRACTYYRAALLVMSPVTAGFRDAIDQMRSCFRRAAALLDPPVEPVTVPWKASALPGYFAPADRSGVARRTLIMIGGGETFAEDLYFYIAPAGQRRGYNVLMVDLPGQGDTPFHGLTWDILNTPAQLAAIVDYALQRPEIDGDHLVACGISGGGYFLGQAATHERRIKAYVLNPPLFDFPSLFQDRWTSEPDRVQQAFEAQANWRKGLDPAAPSTPKTPEELEALRRAAASIAWRPEDLTAPTLCIAGAGEAPQWVEQARQCHARQPHPGGKLVVIPREDSGDAHCQLENLSLMSQVVFDWLAQTGE